MAQRDLKPCERPASFLDDNAGADGWPDGNLISHYHALGPSDLTAATLFTRKRNGRVFERPIKHRQAVTATVKSVPNI
ncbi:MAG: hypothetical protein K8H74_17250 [Notoacmeibacter sp.]|nr:hypothetical protein [Notoacmeibacter sp.]